MATKIEQIVDYIEKLPVGNKVSIKILSEELHVSEGTAYHGIKRAEQLGFVNTLPKAGTTRVKTNKIKKLNSITLQTLSDTLDAEIICQNSHKNISFNRFVVADGSVADIEKAADANQNGILCLVADRPEIQEKVIENGINLLLTSGAQASKTLINKALKRDVIIAQTRFNTFYVLNVLNSAPDIQFPSISLLNVKDIINPPRYLYENDIIADAGNLYEIYHLKDIPVVDKDKNIIGIVNATNTINMDPSLRVKNFISKDIEKAVVQSTSSVSEALTILLDSNSENVFVVNNKHIEGIINIKDVLKASFSHPISAASTNLVYNCDELQSDETHASYEITGVESLNSYLDNSVYLRVCELTTEKFCISHSLKLNVVSTISNNLSDVPINSSLQVEVNLSSNNESFTIQTLVLNEKRQCFSQTIVATQRK